MRPSWKTTSTFSRTSRRRSRTSSRNTWSDRLGSNRRHLASRSTSETPARCTEDLRRTKSSTHRVIEMDFYLSVYLSIYLSIYQSFHLPIYLSVFPCSYLSMYPGGYVNFRRVDKPTGDGRIKYIPTHDEREYKL